MKLVIRRVTEACVTVNKKIISGIQTGYVVLLGVSETDTEEIAKKLADKLIKLRIFSDENGKTNLSLKDVNGEILVISQFTLYAECKANRPSFKHAGNPKLAEQLYHYFIEQLRIQIKSVQQGIFGADMQVTLCNDGPFTILLEA